MKVTANVQRSGGWWAIEVPEVPGVFTQAKRLEQVADVVADAVSLMLDVPFVSINVTLVPVLPEPFAEDLHSAKKAAADAARAGDEASLAMRKVVAELRNDAGLSVRDVAALLEVSHQRVSQLLKV